MLLFIHEVTIVSELKKYATNIVDRKSIKFILNLCNSKCIKYKCTIWKRISKKCTNAYKLVQGGKITGIIFTRKSFLLKTFRCLVKRKQKTIKYNYAYCVIHFVNFIFMISKSDLLTFLSYILLSVSRGPFICMLVQKKKMFILWFWHALWFL